MSNGPETTAWEYRVRAIPGVGAEEMLNDLGREGWELVNATGAMFWLKRPLRVERPFKPVPRGPEARSVHHG